MAAPRRQVICDWHGHAHGEPLQGAFRAAQLYTLPLPPRRLRCLPQGLATQPPTLAAAAWAADQNNASAGAVQHAIDRCAGSLRQPPWWLLRQPGLVFTGSN